MAQLSYTDQRRITFLSLLNSACILHAGAYENTAQSTATKWLLDMEANGFFEGNSSAPSTGRSAPSRRQASSTPSQTRGRDQGGGNGGFSGNYRDPDGPPTDKQVGAVLAMTADYTEDELYSMTKAEVGSLISDLKG